jgi:predicted Rossmann fold nucleotide-binding protein DprA/Smf involved in DNA uptake
MKSPRMRQQTIPGLEKPTVGVTGHRPDKLPKRSYGWIRKWFEMQFRVLEPKCLVSGMALGVDQLSVEVALELGIPFVAALPFGGQEAEWLAHEKRRYFELLKLASQVHTVSPGTYARKKYFARNEWVVDHCDILLAVWNGSSGGTAHCIHYAKLRERPIIRINPIEDRLCS